MTIKKRSISVYIGCILFLLCYLAIPMEKATAKTPHVTIEDGEEEVYLKVNKKINRLTVFLNDTPVYRFPIATGKSESLTPEGVYQIVTKVKNPWYLPKNIPGGAPNNPLGTYWLGLNVPDTNGYKYGIHGTNAPASIGKHVSSGCIRMINRDVEWLFHHIPLGTRVWITDGPE